MNQSRNLAARMGRWSARHRKIAIFGWFAVVVLAFYLGSFRVGMKELDPADAGAGESGRMAKILDREYEQPAGERVLVQVVDARGTRTAVQGDDRRCRATSEDGEGCHGSSLAARGGELRPHLGGPAFRAHRLSDRGGPGRRGRQGPAGPRHG